MRGLPLFLLLLSLVSHALPVGVNIYYSCLGIDGAPISEGTPLAAQCCLNGTLKPSPPPECRAGFGSVLPGSAQSGHIQFTTAQNELSHAAEMTGVVTDYTAPSPAQNPAPPEASTGAATAVAGHSSNGSSPLKNSGSNPSGGSAGNLKGNEHASDTLVFGVSGSTKDAEALTSDQVAAAAGRYSQGKLDSKGVQEGSLMDSLQNGQKSGPGGDSKALVFGEGKGKAAEGSLTSEDPSDYLSRIGVGENIFKVVSRRYQKEILRKKIDPIEKSDAQ